MAVTVEVKYEEPRAHDVRERYVSLFGGPEIPVAVEAIAEDLLGLRVEERWDLDVSGVLLPAERKIVLNAGEQAAGRNDPPLRRFRFTIAHEIGHWVCHCQEGKAPELEASFCRPVDLTDASDRATEREANVFAAELLMPQPAVRGVWEELGEIESCAARFDVSPTAMHWRLFAFGFVGPPRDQGQESVE